MSAMITKVKYNYKQILANNRCNLHANTSNDESIVMW